MEASVATITRKYLEATLPAPAAIGEVVKAINAVIHEASLRGVDTDNDTWCSVTVGDDEIIFSVALRHD